MRLTPLIAGALSASVLAGATVWIFASLSGLWVWGAFIGWASYDQSGANPSALFTSSTCMAFGVVMTWLVALVVAAAVFPLKTAATSALARPRSPSCFFRRRRPLVETGIIRQLVHFGSSKSGPWPVA